MTLGVVIIGIAASIATFAAARASVADSNNALLRQDAAQGALVMTQVIGTLTTPYQQLGQVVTPSGVSSATFDAAANAVAATGASVALLNVVGSQPSVLASVGGFHRDLSPGTDNSLVRTLAGSPHGNFLGAFTASGKRWIEMVFGAGFVPAGYALYAEYAIGPANAVTSLSGVLFPGTYAAVYIGSAIPANLALQTTRLLPGADGGQVALSVITDPGNLATGAQLVSHPGSVVSPGHVIIAISSHTNLAGGFTGGFPWLLGVFGLLATLAAAVLLEIASRRRDDALGSGGGAQSLECGSRRGSGP